jgi:hypothetical protein
LILLVGRLCEYHGSNSGTSTGFLLVYSRLLAAVITMAHNSKALLLVASKVWIRSGVNRFCRLHRELAVGTC